MLTRQHLLRTRCVLVVVATTAGASVLIQTLLRDITAPVLTEDQALVRVCRVLLLIAAGWAWLGTLSVVAEAWRGRSTGRRVAAPLRRVVLLCCGVALTAPLGAASADERPSPSPAISGLPLPDRPAGPAHPHQEPALPHPRTVVVHAGDCLWYLAAADLAAGASAARVTARWHTIHRLNAEVIGPNPDLIRPGQRLVLPPVPQPGEPRR